MDNFDALNGGAFYLSMTTEALKIASANNPDNAKMAYEIDRRARRDAGDVSVMTGGERLARARKGLLSA